MLHVLCLNWNGEALLKKMVPSLRRNLGALDMESRIYVRDNGSTDGSLDFLAKENINVLPVEHNDGSFSEGVNSLVELASPKEEDILLLLNNDIEFKDSDSLSKMIALLDNPEVGVVGCKLLYETGKISHNGVVFCPAHGNMPWHFREGKWPLNADKADKYFQAVTAACSLVKYECFKEAGGMDTNLKWAFEDIDLNLEISYNQKRKVICCGDTNIIHLTSHSLKKNPKHKNNLGANVKYFKNKWYGKYTIDHNKYLKDKNFNLV